MDNSSACAPCVIRETGDTDAALHLETVRAQRLLLAFLDESFDVVEALAAEIENCHDCLGRLASMYLGMTASVITHTHGGNLDAAAQSVAQGLADDIDQQQNPTEKGQAQ